HARPKVEDGARAALGRLERPVAGADEVPFHHEGEATRRVGIDDLRLPTQQVREEAAAHDLGMAAGSRWPVVPLDGDEDIAPPARIADRVTDDGAGRLDARAHEPAGDEAVLLVHQAIVLRTRSPT